MPTTSDPAADPARRFTDIVLVVDGEADTPELREPAGLLSQLAAVCDRVRLVRIPAAGIEPRPEPQLERLDPAAA